MADVKIEARPNGPYVVTGSIELRDTNGNVLPTQERTAGRPLRAAPGRAGDLRAASELLAAECSRERLGLVRK